MAWVFFVVGAVVVTAIAFYSVGRAVGQLETERPPAVYELSAAVVWIADRLPDEVTARLSYEDLAQVLTWHLDWFGSIGVASEHGQELGGADARHEGSVAVEEAAIDAVVADLMARWNTHKPTVFTTIQLYRHDRLAFLKHAHAEAREKGYTLGVKLVRGAYMEKERERAEQLGYPSPIHADKAAVDADYDEALRYCLANLDELAFCAATHNEESCLELVRAVAAQNASSSRLARQ